MKTLKFNNELEWLEARKTRITGSRLKDIVIKRATAPKIGFYELIAERLALPGDGENPMERGTRLEDEAIELFRQKTKKEVDSSLILWTRDDNESIAVSPDGIIGETEACEVKCLASSRHIEAFLTNKVPNEYEYQVLQYFIVNEKLETLYFIFYDPRLSVKDFFYFTVTREEKKEDIEKYLAYQKEVLEQVKQIVNSLTF